MSQTLEEVQQLSFMIILHAGMLVRLQWRRFLAKEFDFEGARAKIAEADQEFLLAHKEQTSLLQKEASGERTEFSVILIHAQDHLMTAMTVKDLANEMIEMYERIEKLEGKQ